MVGWGTTWTADEALLGLRFYEWLVGWGTTWTADGVLDSVLRKAMASAITL